MAEVEPREDFEKTPAGPRSPDRGEDDDRLVAALSTRYRDRLVAYAHRVVRDHGEAEDIVQEVFVRTPGAARLRDSKSIGAWLYAVCYRLAIDKLRARSRLARAFEMLPSPEGAESAASVAERAEGGRRARAALERLEDPYRTALRLRYLEGLDFGEVAGRMGTIERTARTWVGRGLTKLRERLGVEGP
ncbi:MAG TPA: sigma-70 family RNA polymerase sigma factor [Planctomycetota bacterium]|nr:sigma-70 family RNA polymerase sigma factor [Planctomycetota bacterium]